MMTINMNRTSASEFNQLLNYDEKLKFWDEQRLDFKNFNHFFKSKIYSIRPTTLNEKLLYIPWNIDHWREYYVKQEDRVVTNLRPLYDYYNVLIYNYQATIKSLKQANKKQFYLDEVEKTVLRIKQITAGKDDTYLFLRRHLMTNNYENLYKSIEIRNLSTVIIYIRKLAQLWDIVLYQLFLESQPIIEAIANPLSLDSNLPVAVDNKSKFALIKLSSIKQNELYTFMKKKGQAFLEGKFNAFQNLFDDKTSDKIPPLLWIDTGYNHKSNLKTLLCFAKNLALDTNLKDDGEMYSFLERHFILVDRDGNEKKINRESLRVANAKLKKPDKNKTVKHTLIENQIKQILIDFKYL